MFKKKKQTPKNRNTTSAAPPTAVFSYYANRSERSGERHPAANHQKPAKPSRIVFLPSIVAGLVVLACLVYATSLSANPKIQISSANGQELLRDSGFYQQAGSSLLKSSVLNLSKLTIDTTQLARQLEASNPELGRVTVIIPLMGRRPIIEVQPSRAALILNSSSSSFIVDEQGTALVRSQDATSSLRERLPKVMDESDLELKPGQKVLPVSSVIFISDLHAQLLAKNIESQSITLPPIPNELRLRLKDKSYYVKFDMLSDVRQQLGAFLAARDKLENDKITPVEYFDVRVNEKVFYK